MSTNEILEARVMMKAIFDDGEATINGRAYRYLKMTHKQRRKVFAYYSKVSNRIQVQDLSFIDSPEFDAVESVVMQVVTYGDSLLSKLGDAHWERHPADYVTFIATSLAVISFPFLPEDPTDSGSP